MDWRLMMRVGGTYGNPSYTATRSDDPDDLLDSDEVNYITKKLFEYQKKYFSDIPLLTDQRKRFMYNIPRRVLSEMDVVERRGLPDVLSPLFLLYPIFTGIGGEAQGIVLSIIDREIMNNIDAINQDIEEWNMVKASEEDDDEDYEEYVDEIDDEEEEDNGDE